MKKIENKVGIVPVEPTDINVVEQIKYIDLQTGRYFYRYEFANGKSQISHIYQENQE